MRFIVILSLAFAVTSSLVSGQALTPGASGEAVVNEVVKKIQDSKIFANDYGFLKRIAIVESNMGRHPSTYNGVSGGIWQVDRIGLVDTQNTRSHPGLNKIFPKVKQHFGIDWSKVTFNDLRKPLYSGLASRILLANKPNAIPSTLQGQAAYWKKYYNTGAGKGSEADFISRVQSVEG